MKKSMIVILVVIACMMLAGSAMATDTFGPGSANTTVIAGANFVPSTGVQVSSTAITTNYCVVSLHQSAAGQASGKEFYANNTSSTILATQPAPTAIENCTCTSSTACGSTPTGSGTWQ